MAVYLHLSQFTGPMDLLLFLVGKAQIDIKDIFISEITGQYVASIREANDLDMDEASGFIQMAATLLELKSRSLLPKPPSLEEEEDPQLAFIRQLEDYALFKRLSGGLGELEVAAGRSYAKLPEEYILPPPQLVLENISLDALISAFVDLMSRAKTEEPEPPREARILRDRHSVRQLMRRIVNRLKKGRAEFREMLSDTPNRDEVVTLFLAVLELLRNGRVEAVQDTRYGAIRLSASKKASEPLTQAT